MNLSGRIPFVLALTVSAACSGGGTTNTGNNNPPTFPPDPGGTPAQAASVEVRDNSFSPSAVVIGSGGTVTWNWVGGNGHSVTPATAGSFSPTAPISFPPKQLAVTFPTTGSYDYFCTVHLNDYDPMTGSVFVR